MFNFKSGILKTHNLCECTFVISTLNKDKEGNFIHLMQHTNFKFSLYVIPWPCFDWKGHTELSIFFLKKILCCSWFILPGSWLFSVVFCQVQSVYGSSFICVSGRDQIQKGFPGLKLVSQLLGYSSYLLPWNCSLYFTLWGNLRSIFLYIWFPRYVLVQFIEFCLHPGRQKELLIFHIMVILSDRKLYVLILHVF